MKKIAQVARRHRTTVFALLASFAFSAIVAYATPPTSPYTPAETLDPTCAPGDSNCSVLIIPSQTSNSGKYLTTNGSSLSWGTVSSLIGSTSSLGTETWLGTSAVSLGTASTDHTIFIGIDAGKNASSATYSNFIGYSAGNGAVGAVQSNFIGINTGNGAIGAILSNFIGYGAGYGAVGSSNSNFMGQGAGSSATGVGATNFIGYNTGSGASNVVYSNFIGYNAGLNATATNSSNFIGYNAGLNATATNSSNFIGYSAGNGAANVHDSNFIGYSAGNGAVGAIYSTFIDRSAGSTATNAANSIFLGTNAGKLDTVNNTASYDDTSTFANTSILIGHKTSTGGFSNSIALGAYATNTATNQFIIGSSNRAIDEVAIIGSAGQSCTIRPDTAGINCSSDERLKTNIVDLDSALDMLSGVRVISYNWNNTPTTNPQIGFLAQDLQTHVPTLVSTAANGYYQVNYAGMTPLLVKAVQELDQKIQALTPLNTDNSARGAIVSWLGDAQNAIEKIFAKEVDTQKLCLTDGAGASTCVTKEQLDTLLAGQQESIPEEIVQEPQEQPEEAAQDATVEPVVNPAPDETQSPSQQ